MKIWMKRLLGVVLTLALVVTMIPVTTARAATTKKKLTMYAGETFYYTIFGNGITSVKTSKKSVVTVKKDADNKNRIIFTAKKKGSAKLTVKCKDYSDRTQTMELSITVKKPNFSVKLQKMEDGYVLLSLKNNTKQTFDQVLVQYVFKDADGEEVKSDSKIVYNVPAGGQVYEELMYENYSYDVDIEESSAKVVEVAHSPQYKYTNANDKLDCKMSEEVVTDDYGSSQTVLTVNYKNKHKEKLEGTVFFLIYDAEDHVIDVRELSVYIKGKASDTHDIKIYNKNYDHYELKKAVYYKTSLN